MTADRARRAALVALVALAAGTLTGCGAERVEVPYTQDEVSLEVGEVLVVDFGTINYSIGDSWDLTTEPDPAVLAPGEAAYDDEDGGAAGGGTGLRYRFEATAPGTTTVGFTYSYRGEEGDPENRVDDPAPQIRVTVED